MVCLRDANTSVIHRFWRFAARGKVRAMQAQARDESRRKGVALKAFIVGLLPLLSMCKPSAQPVTHDSGPGVSRVDATTDATDSDASSPDVDDLATGGGSDGSLDGGSAPNPGADAETHDDAGARPDADLSADASAPDPLDACPPEPPPAWIEVHTGAASFTARCGNNMVAVEAYDTHTLKLAYRASGRDEPPSWVVEQGRPAPPPTRIGRDGNVALFCTPELVVRVEPTQCAVEVVDQAGHILLKDEAPGFERQTVTRDGREKQIARLTRAAPNDEHYYGLGERTGRLDRRGRRYTFQNTDAYDHRYGGFPPNADPLYLGVPFFVGLREGVAYGLFTDTPSFMTFDVAEAHPTQSVFEAETESFEQYVILGPSMRDVLERYTQLTGRMPMPPRWSLGYHQSRWGYAPADRVVELAETFRRKSLPADALWLDIQHMDGFRNFTFDPTTFPDPAGLTETLHRLGFRVVTIVDPGVKIDPEWRIYADGARDGHFILDDSGEPCSGQGWAGPSAFVDFTSNAARSFWAQEIATFASIGIDGIWLDLNEPTTLPESGRGNSLPEHLLVRGDGHPAGVRTGDVRNVYGLLEAATTYAGLKQLRPAERPFILSRSGYAGIQQYAAVWTGDAPSTWWSLEQTLPMMLGLGLSGIPFVGSDVGGYSGHASAALFARWMSVGALSPFFRGHVTSNVNDQEPWAFGDDVEVLSRKVMRTRYERLPYLYSMFREASLTGVPILRPMILEFQDDEDVASVDDQAMLGPSLLIAPILREGTTDRSVYLPAGRWLDATSLAAFDGPTTIHVHAPLNVGSPTFLRAGAIVPRWLTADSTSPAPTTTLALDVFASPAAPTPATSFDLYEDDGISFEHVEQGAFRTIRYTLEPLPHGANLTAFRVDGQRTAPTRRLVIRFLRIDHAPTDVRLNGVPIVASESDPTPDTRVDPANSGNAASSGNPENSENSGSLGDSGNAGADANPNADAPPAWHYDSDARTLTVVLRDVDGFDLALRYDPTLPALRPLISVPVVVQVPESTPEGAIIHVATSGQGWGSTALSPVTDGKATGTVLAELGAWFEYKYTRGDWATVEKTEDCHERLNREALGVATTGLNDEVARWYDTCP